ncbi:leucine-rich repeat protein [Leadbettera azotonutricia]|uniref:Cell surface protein n=1 Tax=Leadbettera azotonutricia (strain ATCC BAA-888 / DSM 13862 / ZAS-9) TaxID=545695 RepID=F5Y9S3_LEAAZ|nr:leucine-rich repeat protein [Leadbettera azotonutricia]AEF83199.1 cell surface protein [Leadbettera azotonutricia ZAS-9]
MKKNKVLLRGIAAALLAFGLVFSSCGLGAGDDVVTYQISGTIRGSDASGGLSGASVQLKNGAAAQGVAVSTAVDGTYTITGAGAGTYTIEASKSGYKTNTSAEFAVTGGNVIGKDLTLQKEDTNVVITPDNIGDMKTLIAAASGGTTSYAPLVVAISGAVNLSGSNSEGADPLHKLFAAIPNDKYVTYDLSGCTLTSIEDISESATYARTNYDRLVSIILPDTLTAIGELAFVNCYSLTSATIPNGVTSIGVGAFYGCSSLKNMTILRDTTPLATLGVVAFYGTHADLAIQVPESILAAYKAADGWSSYATKIVAITQ